jgi:hypothetical protein
LPPLMRKASGVESHRWQLRSAVDGRLAIGF